MALHWRVLRVRTTSDERLKPGTTMWEVLLLSCQEKRNVGDTARELGITLEAVGQSVTRLRARGFLKPASVSDRILRPTDEGRWHLFEMSRKLVA